MRRVIGVFQDVTDRHEAEQQLWRNAHIDELSGLANRSWFQARLAECVGAQAEKDRRFTLLLLDLDEFKDVNDTSGHQAGDEVIRVVAERLRACNDRGAFLARLGGDEFAVLLDGGMDVADVVRFAEAVQLQVRKPIPHKGLEIILTASIGVAVFPADASTADKVLQRADMALYGVKRSGRGTLGFFDREVQASFDFRRAAIDRVRQAAATGCIVAHYQPKVSLRDGRVCGLEALARIVDPDGTVLGPADFWPALDDAETVRLIDDHVFEAVIRDLADERALGHSLGPVSVNVSEYSLRRPDFVDRLLERLASSGTPAALIELEVVETVLFGKATSRPQAIFAALHAAGVSIALDDFGTGFASLAHLRDLPIRRIKLDKSFVIGLERNSPNAFILQATVELAHGLGIKAVAEGVKAVAEGVKTTVACEFLASIGCDEGQGFLFGAAAPADVLRRLHHSDWQIKDRHARRRA